MREEQEELDLINVTQEKTWGIFSPFISWLGMGRRLGTRVGRGRNGRNLLQRIGARIGAYLLLDPVLVLTKATRSVAF